MKQGITNIRSPRRGEKSALRIMILIGVASMLYMMKWLLRPMHIGYAPLYWLVIATMVYLLLRILHEWYHYFFITVPDKPHLKTAFKVDVFTTYCEGEPYEMVEETLRAIKNIKYPHESYLCDDAGEARIKKLCKELGIHYVTRDNLIDAKAGNINNALQKSRGDICVILDPDHVPNPNFLHKVLPHFEDPKIGFVQVVQAYKNKHESLVAKGAAQQTFQFYGPMMMTMNKYGTVQAIGANCTFRRKALDSIGGHAAGLAEDMHTAMQLHAKGWKSVYEPAIVARGLVPSTLSGYYKQQLKWAKGTTDLLVKVYPKLFKTFTRNQKLHYGTIPFHYFSGFVFLLNFLIPILALVFNLIPMKVDLMHLMLVATPFMCTTLLIRHFVQRWVMEESERGFHLIGGVLHIGTWWINILGVVFTFFKVEVPYDPTPKDGKEGNTLLLNMPNIIVGLASLAAVVYGLSIDWSPFSLVMASLAIFNTGFMAFMVVAGLQPKIREFRKRQQFFDGAMKGVERVSRNAWFVRHSLYSGFRRAGLPLTVLVTLVSMFLYKFSPGPQAYDHFQTHPFYTGVYSPSSAEVGITSIQEVKKLEDSYGIEMNLMPFYLAWTEDSVRQFPAEYFHEIYDSKAFPLVTWEPWISTFSDEKFREGETFKLIAEGNFDDFIASMADRFKSLNKPVFLRFAHEPDNPQYPWSEKGLLDPGQYKAAWIRTQNIFTERDADNVIWVWNPWHAESAEAFFPGSPYVDWIGLTLLNYYEMNKGSEWKSFEKLYSSYDSTGIFDHQLPVMLAEFGSLEDKGRQLKWFKDAFESIEDEHPEIRGLVIFEDSSDENIPGHAAATYASLDWSMKDEGRILNALKTHFGRSMVLLPEAMPENNPPVHLEDRRAISLETNRIRGINFHKGKDWKGNYDELSMRTAEKDFGSIKKLGAQSVKWYGPGIYDRNALRASAENEMDIMYSFWVPDHLDYVNDQDKLAELEARILKAVKRYADEPHIIAWNLGNGVWQGLSESYHKPALFYQQQAYLKWVNRLVENIRSLDPARPVTLDLALRVSIDSDMNYLASQIPGISAFGIRVEARDSLIIPKLSRVKQEYFVSSIAPHMASYFDERLSFIEHYKDQRTANYASLSGLLDINGHFKPDYFHLMKRWKSTDSVFIKELDLRIITPARPVYAYQVLEYHVAIKNEEGKWIIADEENPRNYNYSWYLARTDKYGNYLELKGKGHKTQTSLEIPKDYEHYRIYLTLSDGMRAWDVHSRLNRPYSNPILRPSKIKDNSTALP